MELDFVRVTSLSCDLLKGVQTLALASYLKRKCNRDSVLIQQHSFLGNTMIAYVIVSKIRYFQYFGVSWRIKVFD